MVIIVEHGAEMDEYWNMIETSVGGGICAWERQSRLSWLTETSGRRQSIGNWAEGSVYDVSCSCGLVEGSRKLSVITYKDNDCVLYIEAYPGRHL